MNLLKNKKLLRSLLMQGDLMNTINGGVSMTRILKEQHEENFTIVLQAPSVPAEAYNVILNEKQLMIFSVLPESMEDEHSQLFNIPLFYKSFDLPSYIDTESIEAIHDGNELRVVLPFKETARYQRKIDIKHL